MSKITITTPVKDYSGEVAGVHFAKGRAEVDELSPAARTYFERKGYGIGIDAAVPKAEESDGPVRPSLAANKPEWVAYAVAVDDQLTAEEADKLTKDKLVERYGQGD